jgi:hypothetical protein
MPYAGVLVVQNSERLQGGRRAAEFPEQTVVEDILWL